MKHRVPGRIFIPAVLLVILAAFMMVIPVNFIPQDGLIGVLYNAYNQVLNVLSNWIVWVILFLAFLMLLVVNYMNEIIERKRFQKLSAEEQAIFLEEKKQGFFAVWLRSGKEKQSEEEEQAILLDHGFDGIKELDNNLPQWWLALFYLGIIYMVIYMVAYFTADFANPVKEYEAETAMLEAKTTEWIKNNDINIEGAQNFYQDADAIARGEVIFQNTCATCHLKNAGGSVGPNLTDDYWVNHTEEDLFKNIYKVIYDGSPNNPAMQAFGQTKQLTGLDIQDVASYVYSLNQVEPTVTQEEGGLEPQGDKMDKWAQK